MDLDILLLYPPLFAERLIGLVKEDLICDSGQVFEHPQGLLSIASFLQSNVGGKKAFSARVLPLDAYLWTEDVSPETGEPLWVVRGPENFRARLIEVTKNAIRQFRPRAVGISSIYYLAEPIAREIAQFIRARYPEVIILIGGQEVSFYDYIDRSSGEKRRGNSLLEEVSAIDIIIKKEGEWTTQRVLEQLVEGLPLDDVPGITCKDQNGAIRCNLAPPKGPMEDLPPLDYSLLVLPPHLSVEKFVRHMNASLVLMRGCSYSICTFCTSAQWFGRLHSVEAGDRFDRFMATARKNILSLVERGVKRLQILDETLNGDTLYFNALCTELGEIVPRFPGLQILAETRLDILDETSLAQMKRAGITTLYVGIESGSEKVLTEMKKGTRLTLLEDATLIDRVNRFCGTDIRALFQPMIQQALCACFLIKEYGIDLGTFWIIGHPGSSAEEEEKSLQLFDFMLDTRIITERDEIEVGLFLPLNGTVARQDKRIRIIEPDKRRWGRLSGKPVCELGEMDAQGEWRTTLSGEQISKVFAQFHSRQRDYGINANLRVGKKVSVH